jgi:hypothetical protein
MSIDTIGLLVFGVPASAGMLWAAWSMECEARRSAHADAALAASRIPKTNRSI